MAAGTSAPTRSLTVGVSVVLLLVASFGRPAAGNGEGDALYSLRRSLSDPDGVLQSWDPTLVNPCTWFHITCNGDNRVTRVYVLHPLFLPSPHFSLCLPAIASSRRIRVVVSLYFIFF